WKTELYEGGIRVPALVNWPGRLRPAVVPETVSYLDWFPTVLRLAGGAPRGEWKLEGRDVWPLLSRQGQAPPTPPRYWNVGSQSSIQAGDWKLIVATRKADATELYHLADDPAEKTNVAEKHPQKVEELRKLLAEQRKLDP